MLASRLKKTESLKTIWKTTEVFNNYYRKILETTSGKRPSSVDNPKEDINKTVKSLNANKGNRAWWNIS